jgi:hypothetical protein
MRYFLDIQTDCDTGRERELYERDATYAGSSGALYLQMLGGKDAVGVANEEL